MSSSIVITDHGIFVKGVTREMRGSDADEDCELFVRGPQIHLAECRGDGHYECPRCEQYTDVKQDMFGEPVP